VDARRAPPPHPRPLRRNGFRRFDYFAEGYDPENFEPVLRFPYTVSLIRGFARRALDRRPAPDYPALFMKDDRVFSLLIALFDDFERFAQSRRFRPYIILFGQPADLEI